MTALRSGRRSPESKIRSMCSVVRRDNIDTYRTPALTEADARWLRDEGFTVVQNLVVLQRDGRVTTPTKRDVQCRDVTSRHVLSERRSHLLTELLDIDAGSFPSPWNLDRRTFEHACRATSEHRVVLVGDADNDLMTAGYAIVGRVGVRSFLQRLVVHPAVRRRGVASALVHHASLWATGRGAETMLVNTEPSNHAALELYRTLGFDVLPDSYVVLERVVTMTPSVQS